MSELTIHHGKDPLYIGLLTLVSLFSAIFFRICMKKVKLPFTFLCLLFGLFIGEVAQHGQFGALGDSINNWVALNPHTIIFLFLPPLIYESASSMNYHTFRTAIVQILVLAIPGVIISAALTALVVMHVFPYEWDFTTSMTLGSILSATDPVAVVALLKELGADRSLGIIIEGESLLNDGIAFVLFDFFKKEIEGEHQTALDFGFSFAYKGLVGFFSGWFMGRIMVAIEGKVFDDTVAEVMLSVGGAFGAFYVGEGILESSGVLATVGFGLAFAASHAGNISERSIEALEHVWESLGFLANSMVFIFSGIIIMTYEFHSEIITFKDYGSLIVLYIFLMLIRAFSMVILSPILMKTGYGFGWREGVLFSYAGLRGAVGLTLGLILVTDEKIDEATGVRMMFHVAGIAGLTLFINGTTCGHIVRKLRLDRSSAAAKVYYKHVLTRLKNQIVSSVQVARRDEYFKGADWAAVWKRMPILSKEMKKQIELHCDNTLPDKRIRNAEVVLKEIDDYFDISSVEEVRRTLIFDARNRFLNLTMSHYREEFEHGALESRPAFQILIDAATASQDNIKNELSEWTYVSKYCSPSQFVKLVRNDSQEYLELSYELAVMFVKTHHHVEDRFLELVGRNEVSSRVLYESHVQIKLGQDFIDELNAHYSDVTGFVKTRLATQWVLQDSYAFAERLKIHGEIEEKEFNAILKGLESSKEFIQSEKTCCGRNNIPADSRKILGNSDLFEHMSSEEAERIISMCRERDYVSEDTITKSGEQCHGLFIITNGRVDITSVSNSGASSKVLRSLTMGDIIGGYEIATLNPSIWTATCVTPVTGFFINSQNFKKFLLQNKGKQFEKNFYLHAGVSILQSCFIQETGKPLEPEAVNGILTESELIHPKNSDRIVREDGIGLLFRGKAHRVGNANKSERKSKDPWIEAISKFDFSGVWEFLDAVVLRVPPSVSWKLLPNHLIHQQDRERVSTISHPVHSSAYGAAIDNVTPCSWQPSTPNQTPGQAIQHGVYRGSGIASNAFIQQAMASFSGFGSSLTLSHNGTGFEQENSFDTTTFLQSPSNHQASGIVRFSKYESPPHDIC